VSDLIDFFTDEPGLIADKTLEHLIIAAIAIAISLVLALPAGVALGHQHRGSLVAINVSNVLRALPSLALIAISLAFIGLSRLNITIALVALALPPILTNAFTAVNNIDPDAVESARGMGMNELQVLRDIILNQPSYKLVGVIAATIVTVVLAFAVDGVLALVQRVLTPSGLVVSKELHTIVPPAESDLPADRAVSVNP
jgi:osmoprotectant transport system permease protein